MYVCMCVCVCGCVRFDRTDVEARRTIFKKRFFLDPENVISD